MANETTTNYGWTIEEEYADPYYEQAKTIRNEIDATVYGIDQRVVDVEADSLNAEYLWEKPIDEIVDGETDGLRVADTVGNLVPQSENMNDAAWSKTRCTINASTGIPSDKSEDYQGIQGTVTTDTHVARADYVAQNIEYTYSVDVLDGAKKYAVIQHYNAADGLNVIYFDLINITTSTPPAGYMAGACRTATGVCIWITFTPSAGAQSFFSGPAVSLSSASFLGVPGTDEVYCTGAHLRPGTKAGNVKYVKTTTAAVPPTTTVSKLVYKQAKWDAGLVQKAGDPNVVTNWILASSVDGDLMDGSAGNVSVLRQNNLYKAVATGAWGPLVAGTQFWANDDSGDFIVFAEGTTLPNSTEKGITVPSPSSGPDYAVARGCTGHVFQDNGGFATSVPGYAGTNLWAGLSSYPGSMQLKWGSDLTDASVGTQYSVIIQYNYVVDN